MPFDKETMLNVVRHYAERRVQNLDCPDCEFVPYDSLNPDEEIPDGFEHLREVPGIVKQCPEHDKPEYPWLTDPDHAAEWLVLKSAQGPFQIDFAEWERWCNDPR